MWVYEMVGHTVHFSVRICVDDGGLRTKEMAELESSGGAAGVREWPSGGVQCSAVLSTLDTWISSLLEQKLNNVHKTLSCRHLQCSIMSPALNIWICSLFEQDHDDGLGTLSCYCQ